MRFTGFILVVLGIIGLVLGSLGHNGRRGILAVSLFGATAADQPHFPLSPIVGGIVLLGGTLMLAYPKRRLA
jgi:hypothetical protein